MKKKKGPTHYDFITGLPLWLARNQYKIGYRVRDGSVGRLSLQWDPQNGSINSKTEHIIPHCYAQNKNIKNRNSKSIEKEMVHWTCKTRFGNKKRVISAQRTPTEQKKKLHLFFVNDMSRCEESHSV